MAQAKTTRSTITRDERRALAKIVDQRFDILQGEMRTRREQIEMAIRARMIQEAEERDQEARQRVAALEEEAQLLKRKIELETQAIRDELDMEVGTFEQVEDYEYNENGKGFRRIKRVRTHTQPPVHISVVNSFAPVDIEKRIQAEINKLFTEHAQGGRQVERRRLELQEELLLNLIETTDAKAFLAKIPTLDSLLPIPDELAELVAGM
jgi:hypothetical protein